MIRALIADDEPSIRFVLREALEGAGHEVAEATSGEEARQALRDGGFDLVFLDIRMPGPSGLELLDELQAGSGSEAAPLAIIMTAENTFENAVEAMKRGAFDYLTKPFDLAQVDALVEKALRLRGLRAEVRALRQQMGGTFRAGEVLVGKSAPMVAVFKAIGRVASSEASVLLLGESGTGKELVARALHYHSPRSEAPFIAVNMSAIPTELIESELFGHERGAFTGAVEARAGRFREAERGTLLLDEIGDMPRPMQAKLLRVLQEREVTPLGGKRPIPIDVRILTATHQNLEAAVSEGHFREDLYFRLNVIPIRIPPLRERLDDLPLLVQTFVERFSRELCVSPRWPTEEVMRRLGAYSWPGNVRELENVIKRALVLASGDVITIEDVEGALGGRPRGDWTEGARSEFARLLDDWDGEEGQPGPYWTLVQRLEGAVIRDALERCGGNQLRAARLLGINRNTLRKKMTELGIEPDGSGSG